MFCFVLFFSQRTHALEQIVSAVIDGTVELEVCALAYCMNLRCKCFLSVSGFMVFFLHAARALPLDLLSFRCHLHNLISLHNTGPCEDSGLSISLYKEPIALHQQTVKMYR